MKANFFMFILGLSALTCIFFNIPESALAAGNENVANQTTTDLNNGLIQNEFFSASLPEGWIMDQRAFPRENGKVFIFQKDTAASVILSFSKDRKSSRERATQMRDDLAREGLSVSDPEEKDGFIVLNFTQGKVKGQAWFGQSEGISSIVEVIGSNSDAWEDLLARIRPAVPGLLPANLE